MEAVQMTVWPSRAVEGEAEQVMVIGLPETTRSKLVRLLSGKPVTVMG